MALDPLFPPTPKIISSISSIKDNRTHGKVGEWLQEVMATCSALSIVSAYFTVNAYAHLRKELDDIESLRFLFGDPAYLRIKDADKGERSFSYWRGEAPARQLFEEPALAEELAACDAVYTSGITLAVLGETGRKRLIALMRRLKESGRLAAFE